MGYAARANKNSGQPKRSMEQIIRSTARDYFATASPMAESILHKITLRLNKRDLERMMAMIHEEQMKLEDEGTPIHPDTMVEDKREVIERDGRFYVPVSQDELEGVMSLAPETREALGFGVFNVASFKQ